MIARIAAAVADQIHAAGGINVPTQSLSALL
jgi:hypothetical protein